jgi:hypothetical protein
LLPMRGWELLAGALLARLELQRGRSSQSILNSVMPPLGLLLICYPIFAFSKETPHPSFITLIPVLGTMLLIWFSKKGEFVSELLSSRPFVFVGLISYSLYLWHFPIFAFAKIAFEEISVIDKLALIFLALTLSIASYRLVEKPARNKARLPRRSLVALLAIVGASLVTAFTYIYMTEGAKFRVGELSSHIEVDYWQPENQARFSTYNGCWLRRSPFDENNPFGVCRSNEKLASKNLIMVIGDSNAGAIIPGLIEQFGKETIIQRIAEGCLPYVKNMNQNNGYCALSLRDALSDIHKLNPSLIILGGYYRGLVKTEHYAAFLQNELDAYRDRIMIMGPLPRWGNLVHKLAKQFNENPLEFTVPERLAPRRVTFELEQQFKQFAEENGVGYFSPVETFCESDQCLVKVSDSTDGITAWDHAHLTYKASLYLIENNYDLISGYLDKARGEKLEPASSN